MVVQDFEQFCLLVGCDVRTAVSDLFEIRLHVIDRDESFREEYFLAWEFCWFRSWLLDETRLLLSDPFFGPVFSGYHGDFFFTPGYGVVSDTCVQVEGSHGVLADYDSVIEVC